MSAGDSAFGLLADETSARDNQKGSSDSYVIASSLYRPEGPTRSLVYQSAAVDSIFYRGCDQYPLINTRALPHSEEWVDSVFAR
jgi:hypothetical protein